VTATDRKQERGLCEVPLERRGSRCSLPWEAAAVDNCSREKGGYTPPTPASRGRYRQSTQKHELNFQGSPWKEERERHYSFDWHFFPLGVHLCPSKSMNHVKC
jgi:hypothetical protein